MSGSAALLARYWNEFAERYQRQVGVAISVRQFAAVTDIDYSSLVHWMATERKHPRPIPVTQIGRVAKALELNIEQLDALMLARLGELDDDDPAAIAALWAAGLVDRAKAPDSAEAVVLQALANVRGNFPRGFYQDAGEMKLIEQALSSILQRADALARDEDATLATASATAVDRGSMTRVLEQLKRQLGRRGGTVELSPKARYNEHFKALKIKGDKD